MTEIRFYHLQRQSLDHALPSLLMKALSRDMRVIVKLPTQESVEKMNAHLWTYRVESFLPHGSAKDGFTDQHPIFLTTEDENPNKASVIMAGHGAVISNPGNYELCCELLNGFDEEQVKEARKRWKEYASKDFKLTYLQQDDNGAWDNKI